MTVICDVDAQAQLLGGLLLGGHPAFEKVRDIVAEEDFVGQNHQAVFAILSDLWSQGQRFEAVVIRDEMRRRGIQEETGSTITDLLAAGSTSVRPLAELVVRLAVCERVQGRAMEVANEARRGALDPGAMVSFAREAMAAVEAPTAAAEHLQGLSTVDGFLDTANTAPTPWVVPGLLREGWRVLLVAPEGAGKSVASRQIAIAAAQGVHPFTHRRIPAVRSLVVDLENPNDAIAATCRPITEHAKRAARDDYDERRAWLWSRPEGIDLRTRTGRASLEAVIAATDPRLVCLGPLYKAYRASARENDELAAGETQGVLDDLRTRYGFALVMEHHAPKAQGLSQREMLPHGSVLWMRWPELGLKLLPDQDGTPKGSLTIGRFRRDRVTAAWPDRIDRGGGWPWTGYYADGMDQEFRP